MDENDPETEADEHSGQFSDNETAINTSKSSGTEPKAGPSTGDSLINPTHNVTIHLEPY